MKALLIVSDAHSNSTVGLAKPSIQLDDGDQVRAGTARRWLFWVWEDILKQTAELCKENDAELYGLINGDAVELDAKSRSIQLITRNQEEAIENASDVFEPFFNMCESVWVMRGTEAHVGQQAQAEESLAANFENSIINPDTDNHSWDWLKLELDGVRMDIAHHPRGGGGGRPMNSQGPIDRIASDTLFQYANNGEVPPHLVIRSHLHVYRDSRDAFRTRAIITPAMSLLTGYTHRIGINASEPVGAILIFCEAGKYSVKPITYEVRRQAWQTIP